MNTTILTTVTLHKDISKGVENRMQLTYAHFPQRKQEKNNTAMHLNITGSKVSKYFLLHYLGSIVPCTSK